MTLPIPDLDDRKFEDLVEEALALIPRYNREWTNFNPSDPGIALLELFAWLTETAIYRANLVPDDSSWEFLELIGIKRKEKTLFSEELSPGDIIRDIPGDIIVADGQIRFVEEIASDSSMIIDEAFEPGLERYSIFASLRPEIVEVIEDEEESDDPGQGQGQGQGHG